MAIFNPRHPKQHRLELVPAPALLQISAVWETLPPSARCSTLITRETATPAGHNDAALRLNLEERLLFFSSGGQVIIEGQSVRIYSVCLMHFTATAVK